jgi:hypothetical protein
MIDFKKVNVIDNIDSSLKLKMVMITKNLYYMK